MVLTDWELLEQWRQGDKNAGTQLVGQHYPLVSRFFANKVALKHEAQDLTQETFKACIERKDHIRGDAFRSYLFGIAVNLLRRYIHRKMHRPVESLDLADIKVQDYSLPSMTSIMTRRREEALLVAALRELSIDQQIVQELTLFDELNAREIVELLDVPEGTVRSRLRLAREYLAARLQPLTLEENPRGAPPASRRGPGRSARTRNRDCGFWPDACRVPCRRRRHCCWAGLVAVGASAALGGGTPCAA